MSESKQRPPQPIAAHLASVRSPDFKDIYSNNSRLSISPFDFAVTFGRITEPAMGVNVVEDEVVVRMSVQQFKTFLESSSSALAAWEEVFGEIKLTTKPHSSSKEMIEGVRRLKEMVDKGSA